MKRYTCAETEPSAGVTVCEMVEDANGDWVRYGEILGTASRPKRIYLATPYSDPDPAVREQRFQRINNVAARLMANGHHVYSPISHTHPIALSGDLPTSWEFWEAMDRSFLEWADELYVLKARGWRRSKGVQAEIRIAEQMGKPIMYSFLME